MDSLTQIVLGASVGEAVLGKKVGNRAALWGAIAGTIPDLDVVASPFLSTVDGALFHRGFSHSILFAVLLAPLLGWLIHRIYHQRKGSWWGWAWLSFWALVTHPLLDCFTNWGTQLFWPHASRLAWNTIFVIDPLYTLPFLFFLVWALRKPRQHPLRQRLNHVGIIISSLYLLVTVVNKQIANGVFLDSLNRELISVEQYQTMPTPLNNILWTVVAESEEEFYIGYYSLINSPTTISYRAFPKQHALLEPWKDREDIQGLQEVTKGFYTVEETDSCLLINDLRFGEADWTSHQSTFIFAYEFYPPDGDQPGVILQREQDFASPGQLWGRIWNRILGKA